MSIIAFLCAVQKIYRHATPARFRVMLIMGTTIRCRIVILRHRIVSVHYTEAFGGRWRPLEALPTVMNPASGATRFFTIQMTSLRNSGS